MLLLKPQTFMNLSGQAVGEAMRFYKLAPADLTVLYDELDLAPGKVRVKRRRRHRRPQRPPLDRRPYRPGLSPHAARHRPSRHKDLVHGHVLGDFAKADRDWLEPLLDAIADNAALLVKGDDNGFMNKLALAVPGATSCARTRATPAPEAKPKPAAKATAISARRGRRRPPQGAGERPDGGDAEEALRQGLICAPGEDLTIVDPFAHTPERILTS